MTRPQQQPLLLAPDSVVTTYGLPTDAVSFYAPGWLPAAARAALTEQLMATPHERELRWMYGRQMRVPRATCHFGVGFDAEGGYTRLARYRQPFSGPIEHVRDLVQDVARAPFSGCLVNFYETGQDSVAWHEDSEPWAAPRLTIASLSLGAPRRFGIRRRGNKREGIEPGPAHWVTLGDGDLLVMGPGCQDLYEHHVPRDPSQRGVRINVTFREYVYDRPDADIYPPPPVAS